MIGADLTPVILALGITVAGWLLYRVMRGDNELEWWHFISTKGLDGRHYADLDKLGKVAGIAFGSWSVLRVAHQPNLDLTGFALVLTAYFAFVGGVAGYAAYLRMKNGERNGNGAEHKA